MLTVPSHNSDLHGPAPNKDYWMVPKLVMRHILGGGTVSCSGRFLVRTIAPGADRLSYLHLKTPICKSIMLNIQDGLDRPTSPLGLVTFLSFSRLAVVDYRGATVFDKYVKPTTPVTDYRTGQTGITEAHLNSPNAWTFAMIQTYCSNNFRGKILVGHSLWNDLAVLGLPHPAVDTRDVALYQPFRNALRSPNQVIGLQTLSWQLMSRRCQEGQTHPIENARAALDLYRSDAEAWETSITNGNWPCALPPSTFSRCYL